MKIKRYIIFVLLAIYAGCVDEQTAENLYIDSYYDCGEAKSISDPYVDLMLVSDLETEHCKIKIYGYHDIRDSEVIAFVKNDGVAIIVFIDDSRHLQAYGKLLAVYPEKSDDTYKE